MLEREHFISCAKFVEFLDRYCQALSAQLNGVQSAIDGAITDIMQSVTSLSAETTKYKAEADQVLEQTYLAPSTETKDLMSAVQSSVDDIIAGVQGGQEAAPVGENSEHLSTRRLAGHFSKRMESMSTLDDSLSSLLMAMMGALSTGDVIDQRIEHVSRSLTALNVGLAYVLVDVNGRFNLSSIRKLKSDLMEYTVRQYASEEERSIHREIFGDLAA